MLNCIFFRIFFFLLTSLLTVLPTYFGACYFSILERPVFPLDTILLMVMLCIPRIRMCHKLLFSVFCLILCFFIDCSEVFLACLILLPIIFLPLYTKKAKTIVFAIFNLFVVYMDWVYFLDRTFAITLFDLWGLVLFYWWGVLAFFLLPLLQTIISCLVAYKALSPLNRVELKIPSLVILALVCVALGYTNSTTELFYSPMLEFYNINKEHQAHVKSVLNNDAQKKYRIFDEHDFLDYSKSTVMVLVESWGASKDLAVDDVLFGFFRDFPNAKMGLFERSAERTQTAEWEDFHIKNGKIVGPTTMMKFKENDINSWYVHGYGEKFYNRVNDYPSYGFDSLLYKEQFVAMGLGECKGGFRGICDAMIADWLDTTVLKSEDNFVYWTTLDAHPPYSYKHLDKPSELCGTFGYGDDSEDCVYLTYEMGTLNAVANLARKHPEYRFIIRGDHRPMSLYCEPEFVNSFYYGWVPIVVLNMDSAEGQKKH